MALAFMISISTGGAVEPSEKLADPQLEMRAREIGKGLRCLVCQNQTIDDSNAPLARDLRLVVRERLVAGDNDLAVMEYVHKRYGDFVLMRPPVRYDTYLLWFGPLILAAVFGFGLFMRARNRQEAVPTSLTPEEQARIAVILSEASDKEPKPQ